MLSAAKVFFLSSTLKRLKQRNHEKGTMEKI